MAKDDGTTTTKATPAKQAPAAKSADPVAAPPTAADPTTPAAPAVEQEEQKPERVSTCVVNRGRGTHVGDAVNGKVCSYHAMHFDAAGNRR